MGWLQENEARIRKALEGFESTAFSYGGALNPEQAKKFVRIIRDNTAALGAIRTIQMDRLQQDVDKLHIGDPVTRGVDQDVDVAASADYNRRPLFSRIRLDVNGHKLVSYWPVTTEALQTGIERGRMLEQTIFESATVKVGDDLENLFWNGDTSLGTTTPEELLLRVLDGIGIISETSHILDAEGNVISPEIFAAGIRTLPKHYLGRDDLTWWMSTTTAIDWQSVLTQRMTVGGDKALEGWVAMPYGIPIFKKSNTGAVKFGVPHIPDDLNISVAVATPAYIKGDLQGPFQIDLTVADQNVIRLDVNGLGSTDVTFPVGVWHVNQIAERINDHLVSVAGYNDPTFANFARNDGFGHLTFTSPTTGAASQIDIVDVNVSPIPDAWDVLGFTPGTTVNGAAAGSGTVPEGSYMILTPAQNMLWGIYTGPAGGRGTDGVRVYTDFRPERDTMRLFIYTQPDVKVENIDAMVKIENLRRATLI